MRRGGFLIPSSDQTLTFELAPVPFEDGAASRRPTRARVVVGIAATVVVLALAGAGAAAAGGRAAGPALPPAPAPAAAAVAPDVYGEAAATCPGLDRSVLVALHEVESGGADWSPSSVAGAVGPMQFLPSTWARYGVDADGDGTASAFDVRDAVFGAAALLCANGGADPAALPSAVWNYNHSWAYVDEVLRVARTHA